MDLEESEAIIESILFVSGDPIKIKDIAKVLNKDELSTKKIVKNLAKKYEISKRGIKIIEVNDSFQLATNPDYFSYIEKIYEVPQKKVLTQPMLETLAIITYKQPVTKNDVESIRGVNSDGAINSLIKYSLVEEKGRLNAPGKPILFGTSEKFLKHFEFNKIIDFHNLIEENKIFENTDNIQEEDN